MAGFSAKKVQKAIHAKLSTDATLLAMLGEGNATGLCDNVNAAKNTAFPYVVYGSLESYDFSSKTTDGSEVLFRLDVFSRSTDKGEACDIIEAIYEALHNQDLSIDDNNDILCVWDGLSTVLVEDRDEFLVFHGVIEFRIITS